MGLKWRHHSRYYIIAWDNGPYLVMERHWWKDKRIAQLDRSLQMAIWYVQDLEPNASVSIVWYPRGIADAQRPTPKTGEDPTSVRIHLSDVRPDAVVAAHPHPDTRAGKPPIPVGFKPFGPIQPGEKIIRLAKQRAPKYIVE